MIRLLLRLPPILALCLAHAGQVSAQRRPPDRWPRQVEIEARQVRPAGLPTGSARGTGLAGALLGAGLGTLAMLPWSYSLGMERGGCRDRGRDVGCYTPFAPVLLGAALGTSGGAALGGGSAAPGWTALGALAGTGVGAAAYLITPVPVDPFVALGAMIAPALGAVLANRLAQGRE